MSLKGFKPIYCAIKVNRIVKIIKFIELKCLLLGLAATGIIVKIFRVYYG